MAEADIKMTSKYPVKVKYGGREETVQAVLGNAIHMAVSHPSEWLMLTNDVLSGDLVTYLATRIIKRKAEPEDIHKQEAQLTVCKDLVPMMSWNKALECYFKSRQSSKDRNLQYIKSEE
jgi:hypothetical protein